MVQISTTLFLLLMLCAFVAGALGAGVVLLIVSLMKKRKNHAVNENTGKMKSANWQRVSCDEQLFNGR